MPHTTSYYVSMFITTITTTTNPKTSQPKTTAKIETVVSQAYDNEKDAYEAVEKEVKEKVPKRLGEPVTMYAEGTVEMRFGDEGTESVEVVVEIVERQEKDEDGGEDEEGSREGTNNEGLSSSSL